MTEHDIPRIVEGLGVAHGVLALPIAAPARAQDRALFAAATAALASGDDEATAVATVDRTLSPNGAPRPHVALAAVSRCPAMAVRLFPPSARTVRLPGSWQVAVISPDVPWDPDRAHRAMPRSLHARHAARARVALAGVALALTSGDEDALRLADDDRVVAHALGALLPGLHPVLAAARAAGAMLAGPDGTGPDVAALCPDARTAVAVGDACAAAWAAHAIRSSIAVASILGTNL